MLLPTTVLEVFYLKIHVPKLASTFLCTVLYGELGYGPTHSLKGKRNVDGVATRDWQILGSSWGKYAVAVIFGAGRFVAYSSFGQIRATKVAGLCLL